MLLGKAHCVSLKEPHHLFLQALQKDKMAEAYSEIGMKGEVSAALPWRPGGFLLVFQTIPISLPVPSILPPACGGCPK